jgi:hypothetical protein
MLVCSVSQLARRAAIVADIAEAASAEDGSTTGNIVFAALVDDPASVGEIVDAYLGEIMLEAASADAAVDASIPAVYAAVINEAAAAADLLSASSAVLFAQFDGANSAQVSVTNNSLTATTTGTSTNLGVRSNSLKTTGKLYFEVLAGTQAFTGNVYNCGILTSAGTFFNAWNGNNCFMVYTDGTIMSNNTNSGSVVAAWTTGDVICFAIDLTARVAWLRKNGGNWNGSGTANPATGAGGIAFAPAVSFSPYISFGNGALVGDGFTANFGAAAFSGAVPSGFTAGWPI